LKPRPFVAIKRYARIRLDHLPQEMKVEDNTFEGAWVMKLLRRPERFSPDPLG